MSLSVLTVALSISLPLYCPRTRHTHGTGTRQRAREVFCGYGRWGVFGSPFDGWLMFDGLRCISFFDVTSNAWKLLSVEVNMETTAISEILQSARVRPVTRFSMEHTMSSLARRAHMCRRRSVYDPHVSFLRTFQFFLRAARHPVDSDGRPTAGAQVLARIPMVVPRHPCHSGPALHCRVPSRSERCLHSKSDRYFFVVVDCDWSYLLSVELLSCLDLISFFQWFSPRTDWCQQATAVTSFPSVTSHPSHTYKDSDLGAPNHLPRTRTKPPAPRRSLTSVLYPVTPHVHHCADKNNRKRSPRTARSPSSPRHGNLYWSLPFKKWLH